MHKIDTDKVNVPCSETLQLGNDSKPHRPPVACVIAAELLLDVMHES